MAEKKMKKSDCPHSKEIKVTNSTKTKCDACDIKEHLRVCTSCGSVNCCESGKGHNTEHYKKTQHPIIAALRPDSFTWCYKCNAYLE